MSDNQEKREYKTFLIALGGLFVLVLGVTLILMWWPDVVSLFKGFIGMVLALAGMLVLYSLNNRK